MVTRGKADIVQSAYLAGIIDGEGNISISRTKTIFQRRVFPRYAVELAIVNSDYRLMEWLHSNYGGSITKRKIPKAHHKQTWTWKAGAAVASELLKTILPYMILKKEQAELAIEFMDQKLPCPKGKGAKLTIDELKRREILHHKVLLLNDTRHPQRLTEREFINYDKLCDSLNTMET